MWKIEREDDFFRIFDKDNKIAGYFVPEYGDIQPEEKIEEIIEQMHKNGDKVPGGYMTVPMVKFGIFDSNEDMDVAYLQGQISDANASLNFWMSRAGCFWKADSRRPTGRSTPESTSRNCHGRN